MIYLLFSHTHLVYLLKFYIKRRLFEVAFLCMVLNFQIFFIPLFGFFSYIDQFIIGTVDPFGFDFKQIQGFYKRRKLIVSEVSDVEIGIPFLQLVSDVSDKDPFVFV